MIKTITPPNEYISPCIEVLDVVSESVFCASSMYIYDWQEDDQEDWLYF